MTFFDKMLKIDRRWIYLLVALAVIIPLLNPIGLPITITEPAQDIFDYMDKLPEGANVLIAIDFDPSSKPELDPMLRALFRHCFSKRLHMVVVTLWPAGAALGEDAVATVVGEFNSFYKEELADPDKGSAFVQEKYGVVKEGDEDYLVSGVDYSYLGFKPGSALVVLGLGDSFTKTYPTDYSGNQTTNQEIFKNLKSLSDLDFMMDIAAGATVEMWITYGKERFKFDMGAGCTAVSATQYYPFLNSGQILGLLGGLKGAAEYEKMVLTAGYWHKPGPATQGMDAQSIVHTMTAIIVIFTNIFFLMQRTRRKEEE
ncbi:hypothetical protein KKB99_00760 [bacterium]|nr:hypothetical protein [bacterium]MBU1024516.1 hypothetical protein [bacterium]